ncbi:MAG: hypothetical protein ACI30W_03590 [Muribaculaceae bacterium]
MTQEEVKKAVEVMMAYADGKEIEYRKRGDAKWLDCPTPDYNWFENEYRVKPKHKPKFDPKTLQPFDKVLMKADCDSRWCCDFFSNAYNGLAPGKFLCVGGYANVVIPYNDDTKHLVGTSDDAPEYYRYWED